MTESNEYYPSTSETEHVEAQANAQHAILSLQSRQISKKHPLELHPIDQLPSRSQALHPSKSARASSAAQTKDDQHPDLPAFQPERVSFATRKLVQENERLQKEFEKIEQGSIKGNRE